ncbi:MAG: hypothetical protein CMI29_06290 [Opitutae bacterium]|nr:hypothetical protein [Opitutae bacterium]
MPSFEDPNFTFPTKVCSRLQALARTFKVIYFDRGWGSPWIKNPCPYFKKETFTTIETLKLTRSNSFDSLLFLVS